MATTPQEAIDQADDAFNHGDIDVVLSHYEENAVWVAKPGDIISGKSALRIEFEKLFQTHPHVMKEQDHVIVCGDIALCTIRWRLVDAASDRASLEMGGVASTVLHRESDGHWRIVIDNPWGRAILDSAGQGGS